MKSSLYVEYQEKQLDEKTVIALAKKIWTDAGNKVADLKDLKVYIKPEENTAYYVFNDDISGNFYLD